MGLFKKGKKFRKNHEPSYGVGDEPRETYKPSYSTDKKLRKKKLKPGSKEYEEIGELTELSYDLRERSKKRKDKE